MMMPNTYNANGRDQSS